MQTITAMKIVKDEIFCCFSNGQVYIKNLTHTDMTSRFDIKKQITGNLLAIAENNNVAFALGSSVYLWNISTNDESSSPVEAYREPKNVSIRYCQSVRNCMRAC